MRQQKLEDQATSLPADISIVQTKKRKADDDDEEAQATVRKRSKPTNGLPEGFFDAGIQGAAPAVQPPLEMHIPSRPATPAKSSPSDPAFPPKKPEPEPQVNEDEWAAFEADIAAADLPIVDSDAVISAPAISAEELKKKSAEEQYALKKERQEAEIEGEKEDAARKMEEEMEEMEGLEARVRRLREKREELRKKESVVGLNQHVAPTPIVDSVAEDDEDESEDDDEWDGFRMKG